MLLIWEPLWTKRLPRLQASVGRLCQATARGWVEGGIATVQSPLGQKPAPAAEADDCFSLSLTWRGGGYQGQAGTLGSRSLAPSQGFSGSRSGLSGKFSLSPQAQRSGFSLESVYLHSQSHTLSPLALPIMMQRNALLTMGGKAWPELGFCNKMLPVL